MSAGLQVPTPEILRNRGVAVPVYVLEKDDMGRATQPYTRVYDEKGEPVTETAWVRFTNAVLADMEHPVVGFGGTEGWEKALAESPVTTTNRTMALILQLWVPGVADAAGNPVPDDRLAGNLMLDGEADLYSTAIAGAWMFANGVTPEQALSFLQAGVRQAKELRPVMEKSVAKLLADSEAEVQQEIARLAADDPATPTPPSAATPGLNGSEPGSVTVETSTSSGG